MFWWVLFGLILFLVITILFAPIRLYINTLTNTYFATWGDVVKASATPIENDLRLRFSAFGIGKQYTLMQLLVAPRVTKQKQPKKEKKQRGKRKISPKFILPIVKSFKIKQLYANLDFNSVYFNAWLFPLGYIFKRDNVHCTTNFEGKQELRLEIVNRPIWLVLNIAKTQFKH